MSSTRHTGNDFSGRSANAKRGRVVEHIVDVYILKIGRPMAKLVNCALSNSTNNTMHHMLKYSPHPHVSPLQILFRHFLVVNTITDLCTDLADLPSPIDPYASEMCSMTKGRSCLLIIRAHRVDPR
jgi:hypothetical protein